MDLKPRKYTKKYGIDFKGPTFQEFDICAEDYYEFNRKFRFDSNLIFNIGVIITAFVYFNYSNKIIYNYDYFILIIGILLSGMIKFFCDYINKSKDNKSQFIDKIRKYNERLKIWRKIGAENGDNYRI